MSTMSVAYVNPKYAMSSPIDGRLAIGSAGYAPELIRESSFRLNPEADPARRGLPQSLVFPEITI